MEKIYVGLFDPAPAAEGWIRFLDVHGGLSDRAIPSEEQLLSFEQVKDALVAMFKKRNPKLRIRGMP